MGRHSCDISGARSGASARRRRLVGWLAALSLLAHGWVPLFAPISTVAAADSGQGYAHHAVTTDQAPAPDTPRSGENRECPLTHDVICLCAAFAKLLPSAGAPSVTAARGAGRRRGRFRSDRLPRPARAILFDARAPPNSD